MNSVGAILLLSAFQGLVDIESEFEDVLLEFSKTDSTVEVVIHLSHKLKDLLFSDDESHALKGLVELVNLNKAILIQINLIEHVL